MRGDRQCKSTCTDESEEENLAKGDHRRGVIGGSAGSKWEVSGRDWRILGTCTLNNFKENLGAVKFIHGMLA